MQMQTMEASLSNELLEGEELIWSGSPGKRGGSIDASVRRNRNMGLIFIITGLIWIIISITIEIMLNDLQAGRLSFILILGFFIVILGVILLVLSWVTRFNMSSTFYAITNQRMIILLRGRSVWVTSFNVRSINQVQRLERPDGSGDLLFWGGAAYPGTNNVAIIGRQGVFSAIPDVRQAEQKLLGIMGRS